MRTLLNRWLGQAWFKPALFLLCLLPAIWLVVGAATDHLGANPAEALLRATGDWTLRFVLITLAVTPLRKITGWGWLLRLRRMLGLYAFFYGMVHLSSYVSFDHVFEAGEIIKDIIKRPFITVGFATLLLMLPLAVTSTNAMVRRLGARRWIALHRLIYIIGPLGVLHFWWMVKKDLTEPVIYALVLALLLGYRLVMRLRESRKPARTAAPTAVKT